MTRTFVGRRRSPPRAPVARSGVVAGVSVAGTTSDRQIYVTHLADARAQPGKQHDLDAAVALGMESLDLAESLDSHRGAGYLRDLCLRLKPYAKVPAVREFLEKVEGVGEEKRW